MVFSEEDVRVMLHVRGSVLAVCVLFRLLVSVPVQASMNGPLEQSVADNAPASFLFRGEWDYGEEHGPAHWPGVCNIGQKQSPVDLVKSDAKSGTAEVLTFFNYENPTTLKLVNNGHSVSASITENCPRAVAGGKLPGLYYLDSFHFHWQSEHTKDKKRYALEAHFVHLKDKYKSVSEARGDPQGLAVVGVFFEVSQTENFALNPLLEGVKKVADGLDSSAEVANFKLTSLLPPVNYFYRYDGSLTTPDCDEIVVWTVIEGAVRISEEQLQVFHNIKDAHKGILKRNFRPVMPINDRTVYRYKSGTSGHHHQHLTPLLLVALSLQSALVSSSRTV